MKYVQVYWIDVVLFHSLTESSTDQASDEESAGPVKATEYAPEKNYYHPIKNACWKFGEK